MEIVKFPTPSLLEKSLPVEITPELLSWIRDVEIFLMAIPQEKSKTAGLAAPQVGRNIRVFYALGEWYINPEITWVTKAPPNLMKEGCYSLVEGKFDYPVWRAPSIALKWQDKTGAWHEGRFNGFKAQVLQHEFDHLEGKLCCGDNH